MTDDQLRRTRRNAADADASYSAAGTGSARHATRPSRADETDDPEPEAQRKQSFSAWRRANEEFLEDLDVYEQQCVRSTRLRNKFLDGIADSVGKRRVLSRSQIKAAVECLAEFRVELARLDKDPDACPADYAEDIWNLAIYFRTAAEQRGVELRTQPPVMYKLLLRRIDATKRRNGESLRTVKNWVQLVEKMVDEFWDYEVDQDGEAWAIDQFCGVETFRGLAQWVIHMLAPRPAGRVAESQPSERGAKVRAEVRAREERAEAYAAMTPEERQAQLHARVASLREKWGSE
jgi:hypothetical protein